MRAQLRDLLRRVRIDGDEDPREIGIADGRRKAAVSQAPAGIRNHEARAEDLLSAREGSLHDLPPRPISWRDQRRTRLKDWRLHAAALGQNARDACLIAPQLSFSQRSD